MASNWADIAKDGRRLEKVEKLCETVIFKYVKINDEKMELLEEFDALTVLPYIDRLTKASAQKLALAKLYLGVDEVIKPKSKLTA